MPDPIDALPTPPSRSDAPATFISRANAFIAALVNFVTQTNAVATAMNLNATSGTSASSNSIGTGAKTFTADTGKSWLPGMFIVIADTSAPSTNSMLAQVTSYNSTTGALVVDVKSTLGSGTKTAWTISQTANPVPLDGSVSTASLQDGLLTADTTGRAKMADGYITKQKLDADTRGCGRIIDWPFPNTPSYALLCDGSSVSSSVYADLFAKSVKYSTVTISIASPGVISWAGHGLYANAPVKFTTTGALPTGITAGTTYYVSSAGLTTDTFRISATIGGAAINTSGSQSGVHTAIHAVHGCANDLSTFNLPNIPAEYATVQSTSGNEGSSTTGEVKAHTHPGVNNSGGALSMVAGGTATHSVTGSTGGAANLAAGLYVRKCIIF